MSVKCIWRCYHFQPQTFVVVISVLDFTVNCINVPCFSRDDDGQLEEMLQVDEIWNRFKKDTMKCENDKKDSCELNALAKASKKVLFLLLDYLKNWFYVSVER